MRIPLAKVTACCAALSVAAATAPAGAQPFGQPPPPCEPGPAVVCDQNAPEDVVALGPDWVLAGAYSPPGGLRLIRVADRRSHMAYPAGAAQHALDSRTYPECAGPPDPDGFTTHGVYVEPGDGPVYRTFIVGHGARESIEVFTIDTSAATPAVTWIGCVVAPDPIGLNSVRGLPDGGFITTNFLPRGPGNNMQSMMGGATNGEIWEWHTDSGWQEVPGSEASGANGVELSDDGRTIYVAAWGSQSFFTLSRGLTPPVRTDIDLGFRIDNIHWARDGRLWGVGQAGQNWKAVKIDPDTLEVSEILSVANAPAFGDGTAVVEVGDEIWAGSYRGNRIAILPAP